MNKIRENMDNYDNILQHITNMYEKTIFVTIDECEQVMRREWIKLQSRPNSYPKQGRNYSDDTSHHLPTEHTKRGTRPWNSDELEENVEVH